MQSGEPMVDHGRDPKKGWGSDWNVLRGCYVTANRDENRSDRQIGNCFLERGLMCVIHEIKRDGPLWPVKHPVQPSKGHIEHRDYEYACTERDC